MSNVMEAVALGNVSLSLRTTGWRVAGVLERHRWRPLVLPLLLSTAIATTLSRALGAASVYEAELRRRGLGWRLTLDGRTIDRPREAS